MVATIELATMQAVDLLVDTSTSMTYGSDVEMSRLTYIISTWLLNESLSSRDMPKLFTVDCVQFFYCIFNIAKIDIINIINIELL